jgi:hypothetical protein
MLLLSGSGAILLANAVIGDGLDERSGNVWLRRSALLLTVCVLPLAVLAAVSMGQRIGQYGWTPERIWGVVAVGIAIAYGLVAWWAAYKGRLDFDEALRPLQTKLAVGLCGLALFLALPIVDFGAISARSQLARLENAKVSPEEFDWTAMAFDFGPEGRERLAEIARSGPAAQRELAGLALKTENRWELSRETRIVERQVDIEQRVRLLSPDIQWSDELRRRVSSQNECEEQSRCALIWLDAGTLMLVSTYGPDRYVSAAIIDLKEPLPADKSPPMVGVATYETEQIKGIDLATAKFDVREVTVRQVHVDGKPIGPAVPISR